MFRHFDGKAVRVGYSLLNDDNCAMGRQKKYKAFNIMEVDSHNWWAVGVKFRGGREIVGTSPEGEMLFSYPEKLPLPKAVYVTKWGVVVDKWVFVGFGIVAKPGLDRLMGWLRAWAAERNDLKPVVIELIDELVIRAKHLDDKASTRDSRVFLFNPKPNLSFASAGEQEE